jgi:flavocytochrome c
LGGHSFPRTHRGKERFPGMTITYALMEKLEEIAKKEPHRARQLFKAKVTKLLRDETSGSVIGVEYEKDGKTYQEYGPVVLATGGYAADFTSDSLLQKYRPDLYHLPTTNGDYSTGDGIKMGLAIGANAVDLEKVQVHPTGLVDPKEPDAKVKFLAAEALRGVGGILLNANGERFCDELGHRDYVTGEMWKNKGPFRLVLNSEAAKNIEWHVKHYTGRGLMKSFPNGAALAAEMGISPAKLEETFRRYNEAAKSKNDPFGKKYFDAVPFRMDDQFHVSLVTPVLHFCMGGLEITPDGEVLGRDGRPIPGLFAAGEVCGGVHGANRLGGSSLLGCVVFGRVAGDTASRYLFHSLLTQQRHGGRQSSHRRDMLQKGTEICDSPFRVGIELEPDRNRLAMEILWNQQQKQMGGSRSDVSTPSAVQSSSAASSLLSPPPATVSERPPESKSDAKTATTASSPRDPNKEWTWEEVARHNTEKDCWVVVNGQVLDVTDFLKDHPGGKKPILIYAGRDATAEFNMLHKPDVIQKYAPHTVIGKIKGPPPPPAAAAAPSTSTATTERSAVSSSSPTVTTSSTSSSERSVSSNEDKKKKATVMKPSNVESAVSGGTADVLPAERAKATFDVEKLTTLLDGSPEATKRRKFILSAAEYLHDVSFKYHLDRVEVLREHIKHFFKVHEAYWDTFRPTRDDIIWMMENSTFSGALMNHYGLFLPTIDMQATDEQKSWWLVRALKCQIIGCYAQTELGHGSNVRGLMTTAEYDKRTQEFVLNTPTLRSIKWWPGALGKVATHAIVYAQLIIDGKEYGVHAFMLQIRDHEHKPLPGIELGDLGPKLGDHGNDTGYMRLTNVRIPRQFMFMRFFQVTPEGVYVKSELTKKNAKLAYATMTFTRGSMVKTAGGFLARACTIAIRYSCVRRQGFTTSKRDISYKSPEMQIIDYQVQRYRLFKQLSIAYAIKFTGSWMVSKFKDLEGGGSRLGKVENLTEVAATSAGLKAMCTYLAWFGIEDCRKCCGGNGYLMAGGLAALAADYVWQTTAEGDYIVMMLQTAQFLLKMLQNAIQGKKLADVVAYLSALQQPEFNLTKCTPPHANAPQNFFDLNYLSDLFKFCALSTVVTVGQDFQQKLGEVDGNLAAAVNSCALELCNAVRAHCGLFLLTNFLRVVNQVEDKALKAVLTRLLIMYSLSSILDDPQWNGLLNSAQIRLIKQAVIDIMEQLRPDAVALVDAFDFPDRVLNSAIGRYDGNVYEALWESAQLSILNQRDPFLGYEVMQPYLDRDLLKNPNTIPSPIPVPKL